MRINIPGMEMINIDEIIERAPRPKGRKINVTPRKKTKAAVKPKAKIKPKAKPKRKPRRISTPRAFGEEINLENINLPEIGNILPRPPKPPVIEPKGKPPVSKRPRPTLVDTTPKPKAPSIPSSKDVERIIADLGIEIPEVINIPGVGQIQLPTPQSPGSVPQKTPPAKTIIKDEFPNPFANETDPNLSELDRLKNRYDRLTGMRFFRDPGPEHFNKIKELAQQIYGLDNTFESPFLQTKTSTFEETSQGPFKREDNVVIDTQPVDTQPVETEPTPPPAPPVNPFEGFVPRNIIGPSFDPKDVSAQRQMVADARARMTPGANIQGGGYLTYDNPMLGNKQTQFGGYGQPMPTAPLMNYAGLSSPTTYSTPAPDPDKEIIR